MCLSNADEVRLSSNGWLDLFPNGFPEYCTNTDSLIDIEKSLPHIAKAIAPQFLQWATTRNAAIAEKVASCRTRGVFPQLDALRSGGNEAPI